MLKRWLNGIDSLFVLITFLLPIAGLFIIGTATYSLSSADPYHYVKLQAIWIVTGIGLALLVASVGRR